MNRQDNKVKRETHGVDGLIGEGSSAGKEKQPAGRPCLKLRENAGRKGKHPYRLLVADVDGTLTEAGKPVPNALREQVAGFRKRGGLFTLATGRCPAAAQPYLEQLAVDIPAILLNGALLFEPVSGSYLEQHFLPASFAVDLLAWMEDKRPDALLYRGREVLVRSVTPSIARHLAKEGMSAGQVGNWRDIGAEGVFKVLIIADQSPAPLFTDRYLETGRRIRWVNSEPDYWEILPDGVSKGTALAALCRWLNLPLTEVVAVGNGLNDLDMITRAGLGVAVANASPGLKSAAAKVTTAPSSQGVGELIDYILGS